MVIGVEETGTLVPFPSKASAVSVMVSPLSKKFRPVFLRRQYQSHLRSMTANTIRYPCPRQSPQCAQWTLLSKASCGVICTEMISGSVF